MRIVSRILLFLSATALCTGQAVPILRSVEELDDFIGGPEHGFHHFAVTGLVTSANIFHTITNAHDFILADDPRRVYVFNSTVQPPPVGTRIAAEGDVFFSKKHEPWMVCRSIRALGRERTPDMARTPLAQLDASKSALREVIVEATVTSVQQDEVDSGFSFLILRDGTVTLPMTCCAIRHPQHLEDARIRVRGVLLRHPGGQRKHLGHCLHVSDINDITVITPPPTDPFAFPPLPKRLYMSPQEVAELGKRSFCGRTIAAWQKNRLYVASSDGRIIGAELAAGEVPPPYGTPVTVVGHPETDLYRINLTGARIRTDGEASPADDEPEATTVAALLTGKDVNGAYTDEVRGKLVTLTGIVRNLPSAASEDRRLLLECGQHTIPVDYSANPTAADGLSLGCTVAATGRCLVETDRWSPTRIFPRIRGLTLVIRKPDDIRVLSRPPWWTPRRLLFVIAGLLVSLLALFAWNRFLNRLVRRKSHALLKEEVAHIASELKIDERTRLAVELHDSLSQALAGIAYQLTSCKDAVKTDADAAHERIETADRMLRSCRTELRHRLHDLRSDMLEEPDFEQALRKTLSQLEGDANIVLRVNVPRSRLTDTTAQDILSIVRELVSNALRHGHAKSVRIAGCADSGLLRFSVRDDGVGFDPENRPGARQGHFGLAGITYRLKRQNGTISIDSTPASGTRVTFEIPLPDADKPSKGKRT